MTRAHHQSRNGKRPAYVRRPAHYGKDMSACGLVGFINHDKTLVDGSVIIRAIANMHDRGNGLGGGFAAYGIYPRWEHLYALHVMYDSTTDIAEVEDYLEQQLQIYENESIPIRTTPAIPDHPVFRRYFVEPPYNRPVSLSDDDYIVSVAMHVNRAYEHAYVISSGKNMGVFKGVAFPEEIAEFFRLDEYAGYLWTAHSRFPTNSPGWWGGAHPFALLDWSIVHNGEISSYGTNRRYLETFGYTCTLQTDTEVVAYLMDLLIRRDRLTFEDAAAVLAPPFWKDIDRMDEPRRERLTDLRRVYASAALNGPFAFLLAYSDGLIGLNDRVKLRPLLVATKDRTTFMASEEAAIREISPELDRVWAAPAGQPVIATLDPQSVETSAE